MLKLPPCSLWLTSTQAEISQPDRDVPVPEMWKLSTGPAATGALLGRTSYVPLAQTITSGPFFVLVATPQDAVRSAKNVAALRLGPQ